MYKKFIILIIALMFICLSSCTGSKTETNTDATGQTDTGISQPAGNVTDTPADSSQNRETTNLSLATSEEKSQRAQDLLRSGDFDQAIEILETMSVEDPNFEGLTVLLVTAHLAYVQDVTLSAQIDPVLYHEILYSHYARVLQLDPENQNATNGMDQVMRFYESRSMTLPTEIDPLKFVDSDNTDEQEAAEADEGTGEEASEADEESGQESDKEGEDAESEETEGE